MTIMTLLRALKGGSSMEPLQHRSTARMRSNSYEKWVRGIGNLLFCGSAVKISKNMMNKIIIIWQYCVHNWLCRLGKLKLRKHENMLLKMNELLNYCISTRANFSHIPNPSRKFLEIQTENAVKSFEQR